MCLKLGFQRVDNPLAESRGRAPHKAFKRFAQGEF